MEPLSPEQAQQQMAAIPEWQLSEDGKSIQRNWKLKDFKQALAFLNLAGGIAESEQHHPDLHLTGYRLLRIVLTTHAIAGLSDNDFIVAAKIDVAAAEVAAHT